MTHQLKNQTHNQIQTRETELFERVAQRLKLENVMQCGIFNAFDFTSTFKENSVIIELKQRYNSSDAYNTEFIEVDKVINILNTLASGKQDCCPYTTPYSVYYVSTYTDNKFRVFKLESIIKNPITERLAPHHTQFGEQTTYVKKQFYNVDYRYGKLFDFE